MLYVVLGKMNPYYTFFINWGLPLYFLKKSIAKSFIFIMKVLLLLIRVDELT